MPTRTSEWRRYPARTRDWPPTAVIAVNTPLSGQAQVTVDNPTDQALNIRVDVAGTVTNAEVAAGQTGYVITVAHDDTTQAIDVRAGHSRGQVLATFTPA